MQLRKITDLSKKELIGKRVFLRADFNVALKGKKVIEPFRIERTIPTIKFLLKNKCQVIIGTHLGRPEGKVNPALSLKLILPTLQKNLKGTKIKFVKDSVNADLVIKLAKVKEPVILLENLRFSPGEELNNKTFARDLAYLADLYVNDAFAVCHRSSASLVAVTRELPSYAGLNLIAEVEFLSQALNPKTPAIAIVGGVKLDSKFGVIKNFLNKYDKVLVGGGVANLILKARGFEVGASSYDSKFLNAAKKLDLKKVLLPTDFKVANLQNLKNVTIKKNTGKKICDENEAILDLGPETIAHYCFELLKTKTIVWAGPLGLTDQKQFSEGTETVARVIASLNKYATSICGGGETIEVINRLKLNKKITFISTGGGAMLEFLENKKSPGLSPLLKR